MKDFKDFKNYLKEAKGKLEYSGNLPKDVTEDDVVQNLENIRADNSAQKLAKKIGELAGRDDDIEKELKDLNNMFLPGVGKAKTLLLSVADTEPGMGEMLPVKAFAEGDVAVVVKNGMINVKDLANSEDNWISRKMIAKLADVATVLAWMLFLKEQSLNESMLMEKKKSKEAKKAIEAFYDARDNDDFEAAVEAFNDIEDLNDDGVISDKEFKDLKAKLDHLEKIAKDTGGADDPGRHSRQASRNRGGF